MIQRKHRSRQKRRIPPTWRRCAAVSVLLLAPALTWPPIPSAAQATDVPPNAEPDAGARLFAAHVLALRAAGVAGDSATVEVIATMPGAAVAPSETLVPLWGPFFANAIVALGRVDSDSPMALYYNPLLDIAVVTIWTRAGSGYVVRSARTLPGERLADPSVDVELLPIWIKASDDVGQALNRATIARLSAFARAHPTDAEEDARGTTTFAAAARDLRAVLPRLVWLGLQRARWSDGSQPWMEPTLVAAEAALLADDASELTAAAPFTDAATAAVLAGLPEQFVGRLALDMALEAGESEQLLITSLPTDGDIYVLILCRLDNAECRLQKFSLLSLDTRVQ